jgi:anti-anti-sigma factor
MSTAPIAEAAIASAATLGRRVTIDLRGLDFIDSTGVSLLVRFGRATDHPPTVVARTGPVTQLLQMCGLDRQIALMDEPGT